MRTVFYKGKEWTVGDLARSVGMSYDKLFHRLEYGYTVEESVSKKRCARVEKITYNGETKSLAEFAEEYDIEVTVLRKRIRRGWPIKQALREPVLFKGYNKKPRKKNLKAVCRNLKAKFQRKIPYYFNLQARI